MPSIQPDLIALTLEKRLTREAVEHIIWPGFTLCVDFLVQLLEQPIFQREVISERLDLIGLVDGKFLGEFLCMPGFERWIVAALQNDHCDNDDETGEWGHALRHHLAIGFSH